MMVDWRWKKLQRNKVLKAVVISWYVMLIIGIIVFVVALLVAFYQDKQQETEVVVRPITVINEPKTEYLTVCTESTFKSWLDYKAITAPNSLQYKLQRNAQTNSLTGIRMLENRYLVAMTSYYGEVGDKLDVKLESGLLLEVMIGDIKGNGHNYCNSTNDGSMIEFIVDSKKISDSVRISGNFNRIFKGKITEIRKVTSNG